MEDPHRKRDKSKHGLPEVQLDYMFLGSARWRKDKKDHKDKKEKKEKKEAREAK